MKKIVIALLVATMTFGSVGSAFAEAPMPVKLERNYEEEGISTRSNRFRYYYTETDYSFHTSSITDEEAMADAVEMAARELELGFFLVGGAFIKGAIKATASTLTRKKMAQEVAKKLGIATFIGNVGYGTSIVSGFIQFDAVKIEVEKKTKIKWRENLSNGRSYKMTEWVTYRTKKYRRDNPNSSWEYDGTEETTILVR